MERKTANELCNQLGAKFVDELGHGAFKSAYLVDYHGANIALKLAPVSGELESRFEREITALRECDHPAIAKIYSSESVDYCGIRYWAIFEEYLPAGTLSDFSAGRTLSNSEVRHLGVSLADALVHLSQKGFVHRDIKPANILFRSCLN